MRPHYSLLAVTLFALLSALPREADGQHAPSMRSDNFEEVMYLIYVGPECPLEHKDIKEVWEAELLRARLKVDEQRPYEEGFFYFRASCAKEGAAERWIHRFGVTWSWIDGDYLPSVALKSVLGAGDEDYLRDSAETVIEASITDYLKENLK